MNCFVGLSNGFASTTTLGPLESLMFNSPIGCRVGSSMVVMPAGELYAFIMAQWRKFKGREDERHLKRGCDNLHHHIKSKMDGVSGEMPPWA